MRNRRRCRIVSGGIRRAAGALVLLGLGLAAARAEAQASCPPEATDPTTDPPTRELVVTIQSIRPNSDMEGFDFPGWDNQADIYGTVTIDGVEFTLPKVNESNFPHWDDRHALVVAWPTAAVGVEAWDSDNDVAGEDDDLDLSPLDGKERLDFTVDLCSLEIAGDMTEDARVGTVFTVRAGNDANDAATEILVELGDRRPATTDDLALVGFDLVQVVPGADRMVAGRGLLPWVSVANNFDESVDASVRIFLAGDTVLFDRAVPLPTLEPGQVRSLYLFEDDPIVLPAGQGPYDFRALATLIPDGPLPFDPPAGDCRRANDSTNRLPWSAVDPGRYDLWWQRVGVAQDLLELPSEDELTTLIELGDPFVRGTFPVQAVTSTPALGALLPTASGAILDILGALLSSFQIPTEIAVPFAMVFELNGVAVITGRDRLIGVVHEDFFQQFWPVLLGEIGHPLENAGGLSLTDMAPLAVLVQSRWEDFTGDVGPLLTLPAHELGHTYVLSVDPTIKSFVCQLDLQLNALDLGNVPCAIARGLEEYYGREALATFFGNPARGYWLGEPSDPSAIAAITGEQCDSNCFMGASFTNAHLLWQFLGGRHWIDAADYDRLLDEIGGPGVVQASTSEVLYVAGVIGADGEVFLDDFYTLRDEPVDLDAAPTHEAYEIAFRDETGARLASVGLPRSWPRGPAPLLAMPATFFARRLALPRGAARVEIIDRARGAVLASRELSRRPPTVRLEPPRQPYPGTAPIRWSADDADGDRLRHHVLVSENREDWTVVGYKLEGESFDLGDLGLAPGEYWVKVLAADGTHLTGSEPMRIEIPGTE